MDGTTQGLLAATGVLLAGLLGMTAWNWRMASRLGVQERDLAKYQSQAYVWEKYAKDLHRLLDQAFARNEALIDRMTRMQREGFVDLSVMDDEPGQDGDTSESEGLPDKPWMRDVMDGDTAEVQGPIRKDAGFLPRAIAAWDREHPERMSSEPLTAGEMLSPSGGEDPEGPWMQDVVDSMVPGTVVPFFPRSYDRERAIDALRRSLWERMKTE